MRRQLPVHSPISWRALAAGAWTAAVGNDSECEARFAHNLEALFDASEVVLVDSGTTALSLAIAGAAAGGMPVAIPAYSCYDIATAVVGAGARVVVYDVDPTTLGPDEASLASLRSTRLGAIVVCHLFGHFADVDEVQAVLGSVPVIEDAAQGVGGRLDGRALGSLGSVSVLSFGRGKGMTGGGGGALLAHDDFGRDVVASAWRRLEGLRTTRGLKQVVALCAQMILGRPSLYGFPAALPFLHLGETRYHEPRAPRRATAASVSILDNVLPTIDAELAVRRDHARRLGNAVAASDRATGMYARAGASPGFLRLPVLLKPGMPETVGGLKRHGVARGYPMPLVDLNALVPRLEGPMPEVPGARVLAERLVTLPTHSMVREEDLRAIEAFLLEL